MLLSRPMARMVFGLILAAFGLLWTLQGFDVFGQDGGMNGESEWVVIGIGTLVVGLALAVSGFAARGRR